MKRRKTRLFTEIKPNIFEVKKKYALMLMNDIKKFFQRNSYDNVILIYFNKPLQ
jgi:hypothetical protein